MGGRGGFFIVMVAIIAIILALLALGGLNNSPAPATSAAPTSAVTLAPAATPTSTPTVAPTPTGAPTPFQTTIASRMAPPTDVAISREEKNTFVVEWAYPAADEVEPTDFNVDINGQTYETVGYEGVGFHYSRRISDQPCGQTMFVQIVAFNGDDSASSEVVQAQTLAC